MQLDTQTQALVGQGGSLPIHQDDEITRKLAMLIEGECEGLTCPAGGGEIRFQQTTLLPASQSLSSSRRPLAAEQTPWPKDQLSPNQRGGSTSDSAPLSGPRGFAGSDWSEAAAIRPADQHQECRAGHRGVWPSKKNCMSADRAVAPTWISKSNAPGGVHAKVRATRSALNAACGNCWPTKSKATCWGFGSWRRSTYVWELGTCCVVGPASQRTGWNHGWPYNWSMRP